MPKEITGKAVKRTWAVYCQDGELWDTGLTKEEAHIEIWHADAECDACPTPEVGEHAHMAVLASNVEGVIPSAAKSA